MRNLILICVLFLASIGAKAQCEITADVCQTHISSQYLSDGQHYRALLLSDQVAEFNATLYGGTTYRLAGCSGTQDGNLQYRVFDSQRNLLFKNDEFQNAPHWDFQVEATLDVIIEAQLDPIAGASGCAVMLMGFRR
ncbi:hypothetical protein N9545_03000 [Salibacteraceae bacterium]|jgi:hypothetical protein|nr:hypothetical protein [Salibacteraceae bacterium]MDB9710090.1 hypothetical protein [Salibacteraceae bacterium]MDC1304061.1 hypothetical protein [Salibacteraceae bacterium]